MIYDVDLQVCLESYLKCAQRPHDVEKPWSISVKKKIHTIHKLIFMIYVRMATYKESKVRMDIALYRALQNTKNEKKIFFNKFGTFKS